MKDITTYTGLINAAKEMNTNALTAFSVLSSTEQDSRFKILMPQIKDVSFFQHEGNIYKGNKYEAIIKFILNNPTPSDLSVWLQDNYEIYSPN